MDRKNMEMPQPIEDIKVNDCRSCAGTFASDWDWGMWENTINHRSAGGFLKPFVVCHQQESDLVCKF